MREFGSMLRWDMVNRTNKKFSKEKIFMLKPKCQGPRVNPIKS